jgi:hypothetical protein
MYYNIKSLVWTHIELLLEIDSIFFVSQPRPWFNYRGNTLEKSNKKRSKRMGGPRCHPHQPCVGGRRPELGPCCRWPWLMVTERLGRMGGLHRRARRDRVDLRATTDGHHRIAEHGLLRHYRRPLNLQPHERGVARLPVERGKEERGWLTCRKVS